MTVPLTAAIVGAWYVYDRRLTRITRERNRASDEGRADKAEQEELSRFQARIMRNIRQRTGINVADGG